MGPMDLRKSISKTFDNASLFITTMAMAERESAGREWVILRITYRQ
jgi:hypothetical protein